MKKIYPVLFMFLAAATLVHAQRTFIKQLPLSTGKFVTATKDGGYLVIGYDYAIKYSAADSVVWTVKVSDTTLMSLVKVLPTKDNGYIVLANTFNGGYGLTPEICKLDVGGKIVWRTAIFGSHAADIAEDLSGNFVVSYYDYGDVTYSRLIKVSANGNILWARASATLYGDTYISAINITKDNNYAVAGVVNNRANFSIFDSSGNQVLNKSFNYYPGDYYTPLL